MSTLATVISTVHQLRPADGIPNPSPAAPPGNVSSTVSTLISYAKYAVIVIAGLGALSALGAIVAGNTMSRPHLRERGQSGLIVVVIVAVALELILPFLNSLLGS